MKHTHLICLFLCVTAFAARPAQAQTETVLAEFDAYLDGGDLDAKLTFDSQGNLYGTSPVGGAYSAPGGGNPHGIVFELSPPSSCSTGDWCETVLYSFMSNPDGAFPFAGLTSDPGGNLYGTTLGGGTGGGTVYELSPNGSGG